MLNLIEKATPIINSIEDELASEEDWINEHKEQFGKEQNLFDGV